MLLARIRPQWIGDQTYHCEKCSSHRVCLLLQLELDVLTSFESISAQLAISEIIPRFSEMSGLIARSEPIVKSENTLSSASFAARSADGSKNDSYSLSSSSSIAGSETAFSSLAYKYVFSVHDFARDATPFTPIKTFGH